MKKIDIRPVYIAMRNGLTPAERNKMDDLILIQFQRLEIDIPSLIMTYSPIRKSNEFDPQVITDYCYFKNPGQQLFYPVMIESMADPQLISVIVDDETVFHVNKYGIEEPVDGIDMFPTEIDLVLVPLLAFDKRGNRVGYGKGYYDRFLTQCRKDCLKIGFSYFEPISHIDDVNRTDIKLDYCITPETIYQF
ncbi:MAG: 5-formyltetrahydrofolate cyclo-ligase [Ferruginibacter sp.]